MEIRVTGRHVDVPDDVRDYVHEKLGRLERYYDRIHEIEVVFDHESEQFTAGVVVRAGHKHTFVASESGADAFALVDLVSDKLERQLTRAKQKERNHKHDGKIEPAGEA